MTFTTEARERAGNEVRELQATMGSASSWPVAVELQCRLDAALAERHSLRAALDHSFSYPPLMDESYPRDPDQMSLEELERAGEYDETCGCVRCHWWRYMLKLRRERDALKDKEKS